MKFDEKIDQLTKYAMISNAAALTLCATNFDKITKIIEKTSWAKGALWLFFAGLLFAALHLITNLTYSFFSDLHERMSKIKEMQNALNKSKIINKEAASINFQIRELDQIIPGSDLKITEKQIDIIRNFQELFLIASYISFFSGLFIIIYSI